MSNDYRKHSPCREDMGEEVSRVHLSKWKRQGSHSNV